MKRLVLLVALVMSLTAEAPAAFNADAATSWLSFRLNSQLNPIVSVPSADRAPSWTYHTSGSISSSPTVRGHVIFIASNDHHLYALDLDSGKSLWIASTLNELMTAPLYDGNLVYVGAGNAVTTIWNPPTYIAVGTSPNYLYAFDANNGTPRWNYGLPGSGMPTPAIVGDEIIHYDGGGVVLALNKNDAAYQWRTYLPSVAAMSSIVDLGGNRIALVGGYPNAVYALDSTDGEVIWKTEFQRSLAAFTDCPLAYDGATLYAMYMAPVDKSREYVNIGDSAQQHVYALSALHGHVLWDVAIPGSRGVLPENNESSIPMIYDRVVFEGSAVAPIITALSENDGKILWQTRVHGVVKGGMVARDGIVYAGDLSGYLWALDARTGKVVGDKRTGLRFNVASPIMVNDSLVVPSADGTVLAIPTSVIRRSHDA